MSCRMGVSLQPCADHVRNDAGAIVTTTFKPWGLIEKRTERLFFFGRCEDLRRSRLSRDHFTARTTGSNNDAMSAPRSPNRARATAMSGVTYVSTVEKKVGSKVIL